MAIYEETFNSLEEFIVKTRGISGLFNCHPSNIWFRGVVDEQYGLKPGVIWQGIPQKTEESMVLSFLQNYENLISKKVHSGLDAYVLMQHYGLPTRLLDWTASALVALYFSLETDKEQTNRVVWCMSAIDLNKISTGIETKLFSKSFQECHVSEFLPTMLKSYRVEKEQKVAPELPIAFSHPFTNDRIKAQSGCFTFHGTDRKCIATLFEDNDCSNILKLKLLDEASRLAILENLYILGFREDDIFQDLTSLCKRITREHSILFSPP